MQTKSTKQTEPGIKRMPSRSEVILSVYNYSGPQLTMVNGRRRALLGLIPVILLLLILIYRTLLVSHNLSQLQLQVQSQSSPARNNNQPLISLNWPVFVGSDHFRTTERTSQPDDLLIHKLLTAMDVLKTPLFTVKNSNDEPTSWKFPKIFHQSWIDTQIPGKTSEWVSKWKKIHPDWTYVFWTDHSAREFIKDYFPSLLAHYDSWQIPVQRADMFRYIALYAFGGIWADLDMEPLKSLEPLRDWSSCILSREPDLQIYVMSNFMNNYANNETFTCNAFFACRAHHPFMFYMISRVIQKSPLFREKPCVLSDTIQCTGPWIMSWVYTYYRRSISEQFRQQHPEYDVICPEYRYFLPTFDETRRNLVIQNCNSNLLSGKQWEACNEFHQNNMTNKPRDYSYTDHHWIHTYHYDVAKTTVHISKLTEWTNYTSDDFIITYP